MEPVPFSMLALRYLNIGAYWVKYSRARSQTPKEVVIVFTSFLTRLVHRRTTYSSSASFLPQINAKVRSVLLRPLRRIVCSPKPNQLKNRFRRNIFIVMAFLRCSNLHAVHWPKKETESSFYCFIFEARRFTAAILVRPLWCDTSVGVNIDKTSIPA